MNRLNRIEKIIEELSKSQKEISKTHKETEEILKRISNQHEELSKTHEETEKTVKELSKNIGGLNRSFGKIPEALSIPDIETNFEEWDIEVFETSPDIIRRYNGGKKTKELDLLVKATHNGSPVVIIVETQIRYKNSYEIDRFSKFIKENFKELFTEYKNYLVGGCVCGLQFGKGVDTYAIKKGFFVLKPVKGIMGIVNPRGFIPFWRN